MVFWATSKKNRAVNCICRYICLNNKRSWIKISFLIHNIPAAMEPDNGSLLQLMAIWTEDLFGIVTVDDKRKPSDDHNQDYCLCANSNWVFSLCFLLSSLYRGCSLLMSLFSPFYCTNEFLMQRKSDYKQWSKDSFIEQDRGIEDIDQSYPPT